MTKIIALANQKGGVGKTNVTANLGIGLANAGHSVLLIDLDPQGSLTSSLGWKQPDNLPVTLSTIMNKVIQEEPIAPDEGILHHEEGVDVLPSNITLSAMEAFLVNVMSRESVLRTYLEDATLRTKTYDYILIDCMPSLGMLTINALAAANSVIIPVQPHYLSVIGMTQLLQTINKVRRGINPELKIGGAVLTMVDSNTNFAKSAAELVRNSFGERLNMKIFNTEIPRAIKAAETTALGVSIYEHDPKGKAAEAYLSLVKEVQSLGSEEKQIQKRHDAPER
jgi:chromosome partitioning protein